MTTPEKIEQPDDEQTRRSSHCSAVFNYGGGRQSLAIVVLIMRDVIPPPGRIIMADTGREAPGTFAYLAKHVQPVLAEKGLRVEVIPPREEYKTTYGDDEKPLIPMFTREMQHGEPKDGKFSPFCTGNWKRDRMKTHLIGHPKGERWIGFAWDEQRRIKRMMNAKPDGWTYRFPLAERMIETPECIKIVENFGFPTPKVSRCWFCPHQKNAEWREIRDNHPELWEAACLEDEEQREQDLFRGGLGVWLHHSRVPLRTADIEAEEETNTVRQCSLGACFV